MDFIKDDERFSFKSGYIIGFLLSYLIFFSMVFIILSRFGVINAASWSAGRSIYVGYWHYILVLIIIYVIYILLSRILLPLIGHHRRSG